MARYQYETSPRKTRIDYEPVRKNGRKYAKKAKNTPKVETKVKPVSKVKTIFYVLVVFAIFFTIIYRNAVIDAKYAEIKKLKTELATVEKENEQLEATIESNLNLKTIQEQAEKLLGMKTLSNAQIEYINLPKTDYVECKSEEVKLEKEDNLFEKIMKTIDDLIK